MTHQEEIQGLIQNLFNSDYKERYLVIVQLCNYLASLQKHPIKPVEPELPFSKRVWGLS